MPDKVLTLREALSHPLRRAIVSCLIENPGLSVRQLARELGVSIGSLSGHLVILERVGLIREVRLSKKLQLYVNEEMLMPRTLDRRHDLSIIWSEHGGLSSV
ncbi:MAG: winged helix-turn-helix domain-containing protein [Infirmifilum sp.]|jgi:DNA-binding transcriptional ArsR family regulator|nr:helix-turn-helix domain-containing protein [Infirmifilum uzonense]